MKNIKLTNWVSFSLCAFLVLLLSIHKGYNYAAITILFTSIFVICKKLISREKFDFSSMDKMLMISYGAYGVILILINIIHNNNDIRDGAYVLGVIPVFILYSKYQIKKVYFFVAIMLATIIGSLLGWYNYENELFWVGKATIKGYNPLTYSKLIQLFACLNLLGFVFAKNITHTTLRNIYVFGLLIAFTLGVYSSLITYVRGAWLALPLQLLIVLIFYLKFLSKRNAFFILLSISIITVSTYLFGKESINRRIDTTKVNVLKYNEGNSSTSLGLRLEMYKFSMMLFKEAPLIGTSTKRMQEKKICWINKGSLNPSLEHFTHLHSHYFDWLARYGLLGVVLKLFTYFVSIISLIKKMKIDISVTVICFSGLLLIISYMVYDLTDDFSIIMPSTLLFYILIATFTSIRFDENIYNNKKL